MRPTKVSMSGRGRIWGWLQEIQQQGKCGGTRKNKSTDVWILGHESIAVDLSHVSVSVGMVVFHGTISVLLLTRTSPYRVAPLSRIWSDNIWSKASQGVWLISTGIETPRLYEGVPYRTHSPRVWQVKEGVIKSTLSDVMLFRIGNSNPSYIDQYIYSSSQLMSVNFIILKRYKLWRYSADDWRSC